MIRNLLTKLRHLSSKIFVDPIDLKQLIEDADFEECIKLIWSLTLIACEGDEDYAPFIIMKIFNNKLDSRRL
jgi:hypothetical protein